MRGLVTGISGLITAATLQLHFAVLAITTKGLVLVASDVNPLQVPLCSICVLFEAVLSNSCKFALTQV